MLRRPPISLLGVRKILSYNVWRGIRTLPSWWTRQGFPGTDPDHPAKRALSRSTRLTGFVRFVVHTLILAVAAGFLFFTRLSAPLLEPEEARYAEIPRAMLERGHLVVPLLHDHEYYQKPPMLYWLVMMSYRHLGVSDWSARIVPGVVGVAIVLSLYLLGRGPLGTRGAFASAVILALTARFTYLARMLGMDMVLTFFVLTGLLMGYRAIVRTRIRWGWWFASALACGLGILTKGPVALVLLCVPFFAFQLLDKRAARPRFWSWLTYVTVTLAVAAPWYGFLFWHDPEAAFDFFWFHNVMRFVQPFDHAKPCWFYLPSLVLGTLPWSLLAFPVFKFLGRDHPRTAARRTPALGFFLLAGLWCLLFYSLSGCKRAIYILPALPSFSIVVGVYLANALPWKRLRFYRWLTLSLPARNFELAQTCTIGVLVTGACLAYVAIQAKLWEEQEGTLVKCVLLSAVLGFALFRHKLSAGSSWLFFGFALLAIQVGAIYFVLPQYNRRFSLRGQLRPHQELCQECDLPVVCYPRLYDSVNFYLRRSRVRTFQRKHTSELMRFLEDQPRTLVVVRKGEDLDTFLAKLPASLRFTHHEDNRNRVCVGIVTHREKAVTGFEP